MEDKLRNFWSWLSLKIHLHSSQEQPVYFREREIWWCSVGINIGDEEDGKNNLFERPVLILKKFNERIVWVVHYFKNKTRKVLPFHYKSRQTIYCNFIPNAHDQ